MWRFFIFCFQLPYKVRTTGRTSDGVSFPAAVKIVERIGDSEAKFGVIVWVSSSIKDRETDITGLLNCSTMNCLRAAHAVLM